MSTRSFVLTLSCPDRVGIVAAVSAFVASLKGWITEANHHADAPSRRFFMRQEILAESLSCDLDAFRLRFAGIARDFDMTWRINDTERRKRAVILVGDKDHCLDDLLYRWRSRELDIEIPCVVSNHPTLRRLAEFHGIPFHHVDMAPGKRASAFQEIEALFRKYGGDTMVLARFMQILPPEMCGRLAGRVINIHHSFLPSFAGERAYHQAFERGVKLIGATCHYVTAELDGGPIIDQDAVRVDHGDSVADLMRLGKDVERTVLARGLRYHVQDRVMVQGNRTIVFS